MSSNIPNFLRTGSSRIHMISIFRRYMRPLFHHKWVSSWAFDNITSSAFHENFVLPSDIFTQVLLIIINSRFGLETNSNILYNQCEGHLGCIPVLTNDNITVGYGICFGSESAKYKNMDVDVKKKYPFNSPYVSRFILDHSTHDFIEIVPNFDENFINFHGLNLTRCTQHSFVLPCIDYDWNCLPNEPCLGYECNVSSPFIENDHNEIDKMNGMEIYQVNETKITENDLNELKDVLMNCSKKIKNDKNKKTLNVSLESSKVEMFQMEMKNLFNYRKFSFGKRMDNNEIINESNISKDWYVMMICCFEVNDRIYEIFGNLYYSIVLNIRNDEKLKKRKEMIEERKRRNRLSAARSKVRKKERIEEMEKELKREKIKVLELEKKKTRLFRRNEQLKLMLFYK